MIVIGDTSGLVAAFNSGEPEHERARAALAEAALTVVCPLVLLEIEFVVTRDFDWSTAGMLNDWLLAQEPLGRVAAPDLPSGLLRKARRVQDHYAALRLDLTDAVNVVLAAEYETDVILTLDRKDFRAIRPLTGTAAFRVLPDDL
ncbi:putative nucleic acid-binding protein [Nocardia tenerifensis]|uniref:Ribonuclease VapC n=1 Tax=Nocardia tenerifensis TaxID=228006 RepID=A0A318KDH6_9NOCA|nr:PIN domain-containing protein [Nocardia tenerifensis]PXX64031.1 putative nucleic acid-binding protein [Nocardia tenerifensis]